MSEVLFSIVFLFIIIGTQFCGAQVCMQYSSNELICQNITTFPELLFGKSSFQCANCNIKTIDYQTYPYENVLRTLNLSNNNIETIKKKSFTSFKELQYLHLQNNQIKKISREAFTGLNLYILQLEDNSLNTLEPGVFEGLTTNVMNVSNNRIQSLAANLFKGCSALLDLDLSNNTIRDVDSKAFEDIQDIESLDLSQNLICHLPSGVFRFLEKLRILDLSRNGIIKLENSVFLGLPSLSDLLLGNNKLERFESIMLSPLDNLRYLDIHGNGVYISFEDIESLGDDAPKLTQLSLGDNQFNCDQLKMILRHIRKRGIGVVNKNLRFVTDGINGIACSSAFGFSSFSEFLSNVKNIKVHEKCLLQVIRSR